MAKVPFSKLQASINGSDCKTFYYNKAGEEVYYEVKQYLPLEDKLDLISRIINQSVDNNGFYNPMKVKMNTVLEVTQAYTNLSFTDKIKEDLFKLYDILVSTGIFIDIVNCMGERELPEIQEAVEKTIENIYKYHNSVLGILEAVSQDYDNLNLDALKIKENIGDPKNIELLRDILNKLG